MVWKRCRREGWTHNLDTQEQDRRKNVEFESEARWSKISSMMSWGILGTTTVLGPAEVSGSRGGWGGRPAKNRFM